MSEFLVSPQWLGEQLANPSVRVVDGSWYLPAQNRDAKSEYRAGHIPGAVFFDIDAVADTSTPLPHMLPSEGDFAQAAGALGISDTDTIVVYDGLGLFSAPRVWWTFRVFGAKDVRILDGGLPAWTRAGLPLEPGERTPPPASFAARFDRQGVADMTAVAATLQRSKKSVVDARPALRFRGEAPEPRAGLKPGHMPGARNLPVDGIVSPEGRLVSPGHIRAAFDQAGVDLAGPITTTCGSGVTAAVLAFALAVLGKHDVAIYDGAWAEWGARDDTAVATGPA